MKQFFLILMALLLISAAASAATLQTKEGIVGTDPSAEDLAGLVVRGTVGAYDEASGLIELTLYEQVTYKAEEIKALAEGDVLVTDDREYTVRTITRDDATGHVVINDGDFDNGFLTLYHQADERGDFYVAYEDDIEYPICHKLCTVKVPVNEDVTIADYSDPEYADGTYTKGIAELLRIKAEREKDSIGLDKTNTLVYFDGSGNLARVELIFTPWN